MVNLKDKVKKLTVIYICFFAICALFYGLRPVRKRKRHQISGI